MLSIKHINDSNPSTSTSPEGSLPATMEETLVAAASVDIGSVSGRWHMGRMTRHARIVAGRSQCEAIASAAGTTAAEVRACERVYAAFPALDVVEGHVAAGIVWPTLCTLADRRLDSERQWLIARVRAGRLQATAVPWTARKLIDATRRMKALTRWRRKLQTMVAEYRRTAGHIETIGKELGREWYQVSQLPPDKLRALRSDVLALEAAAQDATRVVADIVGKAEGLSPGRRRR